MDDKKLKWINVGALALGIALLPPLWAVLSPYFGVTTGAVALICAGLYVAHGKGSKSALKIALGFLLGDLWAVIAVAVMASLDLNPNLELYLTLFVLGGVAVLVGELFSRYILLPAWLCGWAIGLTIMGPLSPGDIDSLPLQIGAAMIAGVFYVGAGVDLFQRTLVNLITRKS